MKCPNCGEENAAGEIFCTGNGCGFPLWEGKPVQSGQEQRVVTDILACPVCSQRNTSHVSFCTECGADLSDAQPYIPQQPADGLKCPQCSTINPPDAKFCYKDGTELPAKSPERCQIPAEVKIIFPNAAEKKLKDKITVIGRADFIAFLNDDLLRYISREQFHVINEGGEYYICDKDSRNGTRVNEVNIKGQGKLKLQNLDTIDVAGVARLIFIVS
jgi:hypothetical protein